MDLDTALRAAAVLARRGAPSDASEYLKAARAASAAASSAAPAPAPPVDVMAAATAAAAAVAASIGGSSSSSSNGAAVDAEATKRAAAAAFADSIKNKRSRWGDGSSALVDAKDIAGKQQQALVVSQLQDKLAGFRKDRGVDGPSSSGGKPLTLKLFTPEHDPAKFPYPRNWVGIFIGRDGVNKKRFEEEVKGCRIFVRGEGTQLRTTKQEKEEDIEAMHVLLEADNEDALDLGRVKVLATLDPKQGSSALTLFDEKQLATAALAKTTDKEECAFCGKPGHHHSKCPTRKTKFDFTGLRCANCGSGGHTARDCKADRSGIAKGGFTQGPTPSGFEDSEFAAFEAELQRRGL